MAVDYTKAETPDDYKCAHCGATSCKLWREYSAFSPIVLCATDAALDQGKDISSMGEDGRYQSDMGMTDQIGWYVPAVPDEEGLSYWGYTSVPEAGVEWWRKLPTFCIQAKPTV